MVDTGECTLTGGRMRRVAEHVRDLDAFYFTYGDGLCDADLSADAHPGEISTAARLGPLM